ncbi:S8 family serine peptidase [Clostridium gasigenes]|uniref:S8 family serine peptidase n=1 Tax=Clostridium gasigenes TaxID=94869 RepID=A0A7X0VPD2_9CLOT|nr:S8 family serine peptidase [Clostridium gasigenes]MBB6713129.1 S8 family serine peptidase [Clostridium gasigenes]
MNKKIAIIDTGINLSAKQFNIDKEQGIEITFEDGKFITKKDISDNQGHGTMCASIIISIVGEVELVPIKIYKDMGENTSLLLIEALKRCLDMDIDLINISLATLNYNNYDEIYRVLGLLKEQNKVVVASLHNLGQPSIPASLDNVIGIKGISFNGESDRFLFDKEAIIQGGFDSTPQFALDHTGKYSLFRGNSKATAVASGIIMKYIIERNISTVDGIIHLLSEESKDINLDEDSIAKEFVYDNRLDNEIESNIIKFINEVTERNISRDEILKHSLMRKEVGLNYDNIIELIIKIFKKYNISMDISKITANQICSFDSLLDLIRREGKV